MVRWTRKRAKEDQGIPTSDEVSLNLNTRPEMICIKIFHAPRREEILSLRDNLQQDHRGGCGQGNQNVNQEIF